MNDLNKRASFLFGSGISFPSNVPSVECLTNRVLEGSWQDHTDYRFFPLSAEDGIESTGEARRVQDFLRALNNEIEPLLKAKSGFKANYEDLYAAALQIWQYEAGIINNPLLAKGVESIKASTSHLHLRGDDDYFSGGRFKTLAERATDFIQWVVFHELRKASEPSQGLKILQEVAETVKSVDIFTLNHDCRVERTLQLAGIHFWDGFGRLKNKRRVFEGDWGANTGVCLLKLHGSIDWYLFRRSNDTDEYAAVTGSAEFQKDENKEPLSLIDPKPLFLSGTTVKELSYGTGLTGDIFAEFRSRLYHHNTLICCGYGWGDKGINQRISEWFVKDGNRLVILHEGRLDGRMRATSFGRDFEAHQRTKKIVVVNKWLEGCNLKDIEPYFDT